MLQAGCTRNDNSLSSQLTAQATEKISVTTGESTKTDPINIPIPSDEQKINDNTKECIEKNQQQSITSEPNKFLYAEENQCSDELVPDAGIITNIDGELILRSRENNKLTIYSLRNNKWLNIPGEFFATAFSSPDRKRLLLRSKDFKIIIYDATNNSFEAVKLNNYSSELYIPSGWYSNERIGFTIAQPVAVPPVLVYDIAQNEELLLKSDYKDIFDFDQWVWKNQTRVAYDSSLRYVVYPNHNISEYVLFDRDLRKEVNVMEVAGINDPIWAPNWEIFGVAAGGYYFKIMNTEGEITAIFNFDKTSTNMIKIRDWSWSPDSKRIAAWLDSYKMSTISKPFSPIIKSNEKLVILDIAERQLADYGELGDQSFIPTEPNMAPAPIWSPDGKHVMIENRTGDDESELLIINVGSKERCVIGKNMYPLGWLTEEG